jgi:hypothetical protein
MAIVGGRSSFRQSGIGGQVQKPRPAIDRSAGIPAVVGVTFSFGLASSFTVLLPEGWSR